jgi:ATP-binding cassette subfamily C protein
MKIFRIISRRYPGQTLIMLIALMFAGIAEGIGVSALLPVLSIVLGDIKGKGIGKSNAAEQMIKDLFHSLGISPTLEWLLLIIFATMVIKTILVLVANKRVGYTVANLTTDMRHELLQSYSQAKWEFFVKQPLGKLKVAISGEPIQAAKAFAESIKIIASLIHTVVFIVVSAMVSWQVTFIALAVGIFLWYPLRHFVKKAKNVGRRQIKLKKSLASKFVDIIQSIKPLKAMAREDRSEAVLVSITNKLKGSLHKEITSKESLSAYQEGIKVTFLLLAIYAGISLWKVPPTTLLILVVLLGRILGKLGTIQKDYQQMVLYEAGYWSMTDTLNSAQAMREQILGDQEPHFDRSVRLEKVSFAYDKEFILEDLSLIFPARKFIAIVGASGSGKTTIVDLLIGLLPPNRGEIWIDDLPLSQVDLHAWRRMIVYVPQETLLLNESIFMNVTLGDEKFSEKDVEAALRKSDIWDVVASRPKGIHSSVGERGLELSGGQRQRIAIARAIVHRPKLLVLDEATTALDPVSEAAICKTLQQLKDEITILAISHQPAILNAADLAYRLQGGCIKIEKDPQGLLKLDDAELEKTLPANVAAC